MIKRNPNGTYVKTVDESGESKIVASIEVTGERLKASEIQERWETADTLKGLLLS